MLPRGMTAAVVGISAVMCLGCASVDNPEVRIVDIAVGDSFSSFKNGNIHFVQLNKESDVAQFKANRGGFSIGAEGKVFLWRREGLLLKELDKENGRVVIQLTYPAMGLLEQYYRWP